MKVADLLQLINEQHGTAFELIQFVSGCPRMAFLSLPCCSGNLTCNRLTFFPSLVQFLIMYIN